MTNDMKQLLNLFCALLLLAVLAGCRPNQAERYQRYMEDVADSTFEYVTPKQDSLSTEGELESDGEDIDWADDDGLVAIPDIPQERRLRMNANSYEADKIMKGKGSE